MFTKLRNLASQSFIYTSGEILRSSFSFLLLPLYTRVLTPADYGILGVVGPIYSLLNIFMSLGIQGALMRFYFDYQDNDRALRAYIATVSLFLIGSSLSISLLLTIIGPWFFGLVLSKIAFNPYVLLTVWNACISIMQVIPLTLFRARQQASQYVLFTLGNFLISILLVIYFVAVLRQGALGNVRAQVIAAMLMAVPTIWIVVHSGRFLFSWSLLSSSLAFSLPLLPHMLGNWVLNLSDRIVLENLVSQSDLGVYTLGYQFGLILNLVVVALNNAWVPFFYQYAEDQKNDRMVTLFITYQVLTIAGLSLALALLSREAIELMANPAFWAAYRVVPWVVLGYFARFLYFFPVNSLFYSKRTYSIPIATISAGALNIGLNFWLVPWLGVVAAGINTFIGFLVLLLLVYMLGQRAFPIRYEYGRLARICLIALGIFAAGWCLAPVGLWPRIAFKGALLISFPFSLWLSGFFSSAERKRLVQLWRRAQKHFV